MPKFTFTCSHGYDGPKITYETNKETLSDLLEDITEFLRGAGYSIDGVLDIVDDCFTIEDITVPNINLDTMNCSSFYTDDIISITGACTDSITLDSGVDLTLSTSGSANANSDYYYDINRNQ